MASESPYYNELYSPIADDYAAEEARQTLIKAQKMKKKPKNNRKTKRTSRYDENMYALPELGGSNTALPGPPTTSSPPLPSSQKRCTEKRRITLLGIVIIALLILAFVTVLVYFSNSEKETLSLTTEPLGGSTTAFDSITHEVTTAPSQSSEVSVVFKVVGDSQIPTQWKQASLEDVKRYQNQARAVATEQWGGYCLTDGIFRGPGYNYQLTPHDPVPECGHYLLIKENLGQVCPKFNQRRFKQMCKGTEEAKEWFTVDLWDDGNTCLEKCNRFVGLLGPGCCEARPRPQGTHLSTDHRAYCRFYPNGQIDHNGHGDAKAVLCNAETFSLTTEPLGRSTTAFDSITHEVTTAPSQSSEVSVVFKVVEDSQIPSQWKQASLEDVKRYQNQARAVATEQWGGYCLTDGIFHGPGDNYKLIPHDPVPKCGHYLLMKEYELVKRNMICGEGSRYITSSSMPGCGGWDRMSLEDCKKKCSENEIPQGCMSNQNTSKICKYVIWDANQQHPPGWCQLADVECPVVDGGRTEMWRVLN